MDIKGSLQADLIAPLHCWDVVSMHLADLSAEGKKKMELNILKEYQNKNHWQINLSEILNGSYEALVLTNSKVSIQWVSNGFVKMTGYAKNEVVGKNPSMLLHGENTSNSSRKRVREKLYGHGAFTEDLVNYRKDGEEYVCRVEIHPIYNTSNNLSHYLALEQEVR